MKYEATRSFDLTVTVKASAAMAGESKEITFASIDRAEHQVLLDFFNSKNLSVKNPKVW